MLQHTAMLANFYLFASNLISLLNEKILFTYLSSRRIIDYIKLPFTHLYNRLLIFSLIDFFIHQYLILNKYIIL